LRTEKIATYLIIVWMVLNIFLFALLIVNGDEEDLNNWIEIALWIISIAGLLSTKKWGIAFALFTFAYTMSTSVGIMLYADIASFAQVFGVNAFRVVVNVVILVYLFRQVFKHKTA